jgi:hypothetical protein
MTLLFITGCLEPGKDGVGDYTRELASACARRGYPVFLMSLNDPWIRAPLKEKALLRLGPHQSWVESTG